MTDRAPVSFGGYPQQALDFLAGLAANNNREWFNARKKMFQEQVQKPSQEFVAALGSRLKAILPGIAYDTGLSGSGSVMRIYRDIRFSKDKTPYNTRLRIRFWQGPSKKARYSGLYIRIEPGGAVVFAGQHEFDRPTLAAYRDAVVNEQLGAALEGAIDAVRNAGDYVIGGSHYKRVPHGYEKDHPRAKLLLHNGLYAYSQSIDPAYLTRPELVDVCFEHCKNMAPIHQWLVRLATE